MLDDLEDEALGIGDEEEDEKRFLNEEYADGGSQTFLTAVQARKHLRELWLKEHTVLGYLFGSMREAQSRGIEHPTDLFFIEVLAISPPKFRPVSECVSERASEWSGRASVTSRSGGFSRR